MGDTIRVYAADGIWRAVAMSQPKTKVVLGRTFTWSEWHSEWQFKLAKGILTLRRIAIEAPFWQACIQRTFGDDTWTIEFGEGPTEADAILALQSQLRKMAQLEVET